MGIKFPITFYELSVFRAVDLKAFGLVFPKSAAYCAARFVVSPVQCIYMGVLFCGLY